MSVPKNFNESLFLFNRGYTTSILAVSDQGRQSLSSQPHCLCFMKVFLSHRSKVRNEHGLGARQHSLWPNVHSIHLAIWTKASLYYDFCGSPWIFIQITNFFKLRRSNHKSNAPLLHHGGLLWNHTYCMVGIPWMSFSASCLKPTMNLM